MRFAEWLQQKLDEHRLRQVDFARRAKLSQGPISRWLRGDGGPDVGSLIKIAAFFHADIRELAGLTGLSEDTKQALVQVLPSQWDHKEPQLEDLFPAKQDRQAHQLLQEVLDTQRVSLVEGLNLIQVTLNRMETQEARIRAVLKALPDVLMLISPEGEIRDVAGNTAGLARTPESMIGRRCSQILTEETAGRVMLAIAEAVHTGEVQTVQIGLPQLGVVDGNDEWELRFCDTKKGEVLCLARNLATAPAQARS